MAASKKPARAKRYWLFKSEPGTYSIDDLAREKRTHWEGVRNYQARNLLRDDVQVGDGVLFYHSSSDPLGVMGVAKVVRAGYPDPSQFDPASDYHDPASDPQAPRWFTVDIGFVLRFELPVLRSAMLGDAALADMMVLQRGSRLSVQPVEPAHWRRVLALAGEKIDW